MTTPYALPDRATLLDRALGVVLASAAGDALGAPYENERWAQLELSHTPGPMELTASKEWARGEWTDDTAMAVPILEAVAAGTDVRSPQGKDYLARRWSEWAWAGAKGIGITTMLVFVHTRSVTSADASIASTPGGLSKAMEGQAERVHRDTKGKSAGNGCIMRVGPLALGFLGQHDAPALAEAARAQAHITHFDPVAGDAAALWSLAIRSAVLTGETPDLTTYLECIPPERRDLWAGYIAAANDAAGPHDFNATNGWSVGALQGAWAALRHCGSEGTRAVLEAAVRGGGDTDTVAAIAGALAGGVYGASTVPKDWVDQAHGWPDMRARDLEQLVEQALARYDTATGH